MRFNPKANIGGGRVSGSSGGRGFGGGGGRLPIPIPRTKSGLAITVVLVLGYFFLRSCLGVDLGGGLGGATGGSGLGTGNDGTSQTRGDGTDYDQCRTGEDANQDESCARKAVALSLEQYWEQQGIQGWRPAPIQTFSGRASTGGCGSADSGVGPFYCPADMTIYLDPTFFPQVLEGQLGGRGGDFVEPYVLGHEYGHHISRITGDMGRVRTQQGPDSDAVRLELQADCYAGVWTSAAESTTDDSGVAIFAEIDRGDIEEAVNAAYTVGDDHIQKVSGGSVNAEAWTHGSSQQRMDHFMHGYESGDPDSCAWDTLPVS